jgi:hypothetical protein
MIITGKYGDKLDLSYLALEEQDLMSMKLSEIQALRNKPKMINWDLIENDDIQKVDALKYQFFQLLKKADGQIELYLDLCKKAQSRVIVECGNLVSEMEIIEKTKNYPGLEILYKSACKLKSPDYIYALMQQIVLKQREISRSFANEIKVRNQKVAEHLAKGEKFDGTFTYEELQRMDQGAAALALQRAFMQVSDVLAGNKKPDSYTDEFCVIQPDEKEVRAVFISVGNRAANKPNISQVERLIGEANLYFNPSSECRLEAEVKIKINCGSIGGEPTPIVAKIPYYLRSYSIKAQK